VFDIPNFPVSQLLKFSHNGSILPE